MQGSGKLGLQIVGVEIFVSFQQILLYALHHTCINYFLPTQL